MAANQVYDCIGKYGFIYRKGQSQQAHQLQFSLPVSVTAARTFTSKERVYAPSLTSQDQGTDDSIASSHHEEGTLHSRTQLEATVHPINRQTEKVVGNSQVVFSHEGGAPTLPSEGGATAPQLVSTNGFEEEDEIGDVDIEKEVEFSTFLEELRNIYTKPVSGERFLPNAADVDAALESLANDSELYFRYLCSEEPTTTSSLGQDLQERIDHLKSTLERYKCELKAWDDVTRLKERVVEDSKKTFDSERDVDFSQLHCEDVETLKSYLTAHQTSILEQPLIADPQFTTATEKQLDAIECKLDAELKRIQNHCHLVNSRLKLGSHQDEDTPRTVFKALKNHS